MSVVNEKLLDELKLVRASNPDWSYDQAWAVVTAKKAIAGDLGAAARTVQAENAGMDFETAWNLVEAEALPFLSKGLTVGQALVLARKAKAEPKQSFDQWLDGALKRITERPARVEADAVPEHPFQAEANRRGLLLIEGGFCNPI